MSIDAKLVKTLRDKTGAGMMDCKRALVETSGDLEKAIDHLRKSGVAKAEKKGVRETKEGLVYSYIHAGGRLGVLVELNCETDFVANTDGFIELVLEDEVAGLFVGMIKWKTKSDMEKHIHLAIKAIKHVILQGGRKTIRIILFKFNLAIPTQSIHPFSI